MCRTLILVACLVIMAPHPSRAQQLMESYQAYLSEQDHFNSNGERLTSAAAIIRQDRANFHRYGLRDRDDEGDSFFGDMENRAALESMLERGRAAPGVISRIVNGTPLIRVEVWRGNAGPFVVVSLINPSGISSERSQITDPPKQAPAQTERELVGFKTPSNNIYCQMDGGGAPEGESNRYLRCDIRDINSIIPPKPRDCEFDWGQAFAIGADGLSGQRMCYSDTVVDDGLLTLSYGSVWQRGGFTCKSEESGLTCFNASEHGFSLSKNSQRLF
jgi:hypothetical protein